MAGRRATTKNNELVENSNNETFENKPKIITKKKFQLDDLVKVTNATQGKLILRDSDGFPNVFENFGDELEMEYKEVLNLKKKSIALFKNNYIEVEPDVALALGVDKFYLNSLPVAEFDEIFNLDINELREKISSFSDSIKRAIGMRAIKLIDDGILDSMKKINALEEFLGYKLIEN